MTAITIIIGSRADQPGQLAIAKELKKLGVTVFYEDYQHPDYKVRYDTSMAVVLGDRYEIAQTTLRYHEHQIPVAHIHAGELAGQEPDDTYRDVISRLSTYLFTPHKLAAVSCKMMGYKAKVYNCGSPYISVAASVPRVSALPFWGEPEDTNRVFVACNPLPQDDDSTMEMCNSIKSVTKGHRLVVIAPNTDKNRDTVLKVFKHCDKVNILSSVTHDEYINLMRDCTYMIGNSSSGIIEGGFVGVPYVCVGDRQKYRLYGNNVQPCGGSEYHVRMAVGRALTSKRKVSKVYGDKDSAMKIAKQLANCIGIK